MPTHARTSPPPLEEPESKKIAFVAPIFASSEISKTINIYVIETWYNHCHNKKKMKWYKYGTYKIPHFRNMVLS